MIDDKIADALVGADPVTAETLSEMCVRYGSDKATRHSYCDIYEKLFAPLRNEGIKLLELGIHKGDSIRMWLEWFPNALIYGLDNDPANCQTPPDSRACYFCGDQANETFLRETFSRRQYDIIIDDASHEPDKQILSFHYLWRYVKPGGYYIIEDLRNDLVAEFWNIPGARVCLNKKNNVEDDILVIFKKQ